MSLQLKNKKTKRLGAVCKRNEPNNVVASSNIILK